LLEGARVEADMVCISVPEARYDNVEVSEKMYLTIIYKRIIIKMISKIVDISILYIYISQFLNY
jgi:hypothetical protein